MYNPAKRAKKRVVVSSDKTKTLYSEEFDEAYHSAKDGALKESLQKHVNPALGIKSSKSKLVILDICFGLGYNTLATIYYIKKHDLPIKVHIVSPELDEELVRSLAGFDYPPEFDELKPVIQKISRDLYYEDERFKIEILIGDARKTVSEMIKNGSNCPLFDIVYQDAFSPTKNPMLWTKEWFRDIRALCRNDVVLTTYSTASATRMGLYENGFGVYIHRGSEVRYSTIASPMRLDGFEYIDMELKKIRNPNAKSLKDRDFFV